MFSIVINWIIPTLFAGVGIALCVAAGSISTSVVSRGPRAVIVYALQTAAIASSFGAIAGVLVWQMGHLGSPLTGAYTVGVLTGMSSLLVPFWQLKEGYNYASHLRKSAPQIQAFAILFFDTIDTNRDGEITEDDMCEAMHSFAIDEQQLLQSMRNQLPEIGHAIGSTSSTTYVWINIANGGGYFSPITLTNTIYAINRADLISYVDRIVEKYKRWVCY